MLSQLLELVKNNAGDAIINNPDVPNQKNDEAIQLATNGIADFLKGQMAGGNVQNLMQIFQGGANSGLVQNISSQVAGNLGSKLGLSQAQSQAIVQQLIPVVMEKFISKTNDPNDKSFDIQSIVSTLSSANGGVGGGLLGKLGGLFK